MTLELLAALWLHEPHKGLIARAVQEIGLPDAAPHELAVAYSDLFLLNVYPYASVFLEPSGEMNGARTREVAALYDRYGYAPPELNEVGAADHIGLMLGCAAVVGADRIWPHLMDWAPVLCLAIERAPTTHPFYQALAIRTRKLCWDTALPCPNTAALCSYRETNHPTDRLLPPEPSIEPPEPSLDAFVRHLLTPAQSGIFLTRARLGLWARALGMPLPFGERFAVGEMLFEMASAMGQSETLLDWLRAEVEAWDATYARWADEFGWEYARMWRARTAGTLHLLEENYP